MEQCGVYNNEIISLGFTKLLWIESHQDHYIINLIWGLPDLTNIIYFFERCEIIIYRIAPSMRDVRGALGAQRSSGSPAAGWLFSALKQTQRSTGPSRQGLLYSENNTTCTGYILSARVIYRDTTTSSEFQRVSLQTSENLELYVALAREVCTIY